MDRIAALLAQAEHPGTTDVEAEAFFAAAQRIATAAEISLETARQHQADKTKRETPIQKQIVLVQRRQGAKVPNNSAQFCELFMAIGQANSLKFNIFHNSTGVIAFGMPSDIEVTEMLYASLSAQMVSSCAAAMKSGEYKKETYWAESTYRERPMDGRVFRSSFYGGFVSRIGLRLRTAREEALADIRAQEKDIQVGGTDVVVRGKQLEVAEFYKGASNARGSWKGGSASTYGSSGGRNAGDSAGASARMGASKQLAYKTGIGA